MHTGNIPIMLDTRSWSSSPSTDSHTSSPVVSLKSIQGGSFGDVNFSSKILMLNGISIERGHMAPKEWSDVAFALGIPTVSETRICRQANNFHSKMRKQVKTSRKTIAHTFRPLLVSLLDSCKYLDYQIGQEYHRDSACLNEALENTVLRIPTPQPVFSIGYTSAAFTSTQHEMQQGLVASLSDSPCDLGHVAQPIDGHFWPFFVVEVSEISLEAARQSCSISAACGNHAVSILNHSASPPTPMYGVRPRLSAADAPRVFSLAIYGKQAALSTHTHDGDSFTMDTIQTYQLDVVEETVALASRLQSIFVWGMHKRMITIIEQLNQLERKVYHDAGVYSMNRDKLMVDSAPTTPDLMDPDYVPERKRKSESRRASFRLPVWMWPFSKKL